MSNITEVKRHYFKPGAMSIIQMGEELIGHPTTAINELVKNGYDADATDCFVYVNTDTSNSFVFIYDNGLGMSHSILFGDWLKPSMSSKRKQDAKSEIFDRKFLGSKGIGRLAAMALGKILTVISKTSKETEYNWLSINSELFKSEQLLSNVNFPGDQISDYTELFTKEAYLKLRNVERNNTLLDLLNEEKFKGFKEGTLILIENIDESLLTIFKRDFEEGQDNEQGITIHETAVYKSLSVLMTPILLNGQIQNELLEEGIIELKKEIAKPDNTFRIHFGTDAIHDLFYLNFIKVNSIPLLDKFDYRTIGKVDIYGNVRGKFICKRLEEHSFEEVFSIDNNEVFDFEYKKAKRINNDIDKDFKSRLLNKEAGEFYFDIRIYDRGEEDSREKLFSLIKGNSLSQKKSIIDSLLGLRISKNGFGVKPYGEENKDWMGLGQLRVQNPGQNVSTNQILGYIFFYSPFNDELREKTNREGFYENKAFLEVKHIIQVVFKNIGRIRYNYRLRHNIGRTSVNKLQRPDGVQFIDFIKNESNQDLILKKSEEFVKEVSTALDNMEDTLTFSQRLASLGTGLELVYHELSQPIAKIGGSRAIMNKKLNKIDNQETRNIFIQEISQIGSYVAELDELKSSLKPAIGKSIPQRFKPVNTFRKVCHLFKKDIEEDNIEVRTNTGANNFEIEDYEYPLWISFLNIINNAVYWLKLNQNDKKQISFNIDEVGNISISNNGPLIPEDDVDLVFKYGFTLKKEKNATGLGLAFTKNILNLNDWSINVVNEDNGPIFTIYKAKK